MCVSSASNTFEIQNLLYNRGGNANFECQENVRNAECVVSYTGNMFIQPQEIQREYVRIPQNCRSTQIIFEAFRRGN